LERSDGSDTANAGGPRPDGRRWRALLGGELGRYALAFGLSVAVMLLVPALLSNMFLVFGVLMAAVWPLSRWRRMRP